jgi:hypothetical protein
MPQVTHLSPICRSCWGLTFPGHFALHSVLLNLLVIVVLTRAVNALGPGRVRLDATANCDYLD